MTMIVIVLSHPPAPAHTVAPMHCVPRRRGPPTPLAGPTRPPTAQSGPQSLVSLDAPVVSLLRLATEDCRAFCIEKNSTSPEVSTALLLVVQVAVQEIMDAATVGSTHTCWQS